ncbi:hypothetical protein HZQ19_03315 [Elizabethkingia anophelis]|uniref:DUF6705 family protein n=1 Tax=Elizabethkingia anophelis TaxID=1117645 RepID=UPI000C99957A|nr:DUF6705 family protein [Elizabethkingia anophelis]MCT3758987.1 hypothetical protein [Elizabethkingia anophelis]MCT3972420.1 hypothetical protein [Elizabethkingia anophelis]MCT4000896.1 hypothetical protein [Elizabethkingia anophelis]MCT4015041.1 hypothetical protein [Elizabethkingia anophelis]MCT4018476.1 hypothetical protein [Elizabethkingia anophelis]
MKNLFLIITSVVLSVFYKGQEYPLNTSLDNIPNNAYLKDTNNELGKYIGLWKGEWNGKTLYLDLRKIKYYSKGNYLSYYKDQVVGERKIIGTNGIVEIDRISNFDTESPEFSGIFRSLKNGNWSRIYFSPKDMCMKRASLDITSFTGTQMTLHFEYMPSSVDPNCKHNAYVDQYGEFPVNFPKDIVLTKQ